MSDAILAAGGILPEQTSARSAPNRATRPNLASLLFLFWYFCLTTLGPRQDLPKCETQRQFLPGNPAKTAAARLTTTRTLAV